MVGLVTEASLAYGHPAYGRTAHALVWSYMRWLTPSKQVIRHVTIKDEKNTHACQRGCPWSLRWREFGHVVARVDHERLNSTWLVKVSTSSWCRGWKGYKNIGISWGTRLVFGMACTHWFNASFGVIRLEGSRLRILSRRSTKAASSFTSESCIFLVMWCGISRACKPWLGFGGTLILLITSWKIGQARSSAHHPHPDVNVAHLQPPWPCSFQDSKSCHSPHWSGRHRIWPFSIA